MISRSLTLRRLLCRGLAVAALLVGGLPSPARAGEPWLPSDDAQVLMRLPAGSARRDPRLKALLDAAAADPRDLDAALDLADHYLALGRARQDSRFMGYAQAALATWWDLPQPPAPVRLVRADVRQHRHDFAAALTELDQILAEAPREPRALLARAQILMVLGRPREAAPSCARLARITASLVVATCSAGVQILTGRAEAAAGLIEVALARAPEATVALRSWSLGVLGQSLEALGRSDEALAAYRGAIAIDPDDAWLKSALADLHLARGEAERAAAVVGGDLDNDGQLLRLALARQAMKREVAPLRAMLEERFMAAAARGDGIGQREEARFRLEITEEPARGLLLAQANWLVQREVVDAGLLLSAADLADRPDAARPVLDWIRLTGIVDARLEPLRRELVARLGEGQG